MKQLPTTTPTAFCKAYTERSLLEYQENKIYGSHWPTMARIVERADELTPAFNEIIDNFGYRDLRSHHTNRHYVWLLLEHIWMSADFAKDRVVDAKWQKKNLESLSRTIIESAETLFDALVQQKELLEISGFQPTDYQTGIGLFLSAGNNNPLFDSFIQEPLNALRARYDLKYWPCKTEIVRCIAEFEKLLESPSHYDFPADVLSGRVSNFKNFVISFDSHLDDEDNGLPSGFKFSNNAMACIVNNILDLPSESLATSDAIRLIRHRKSHS